MDPELLINSPESDEDLFDIGYPPSTAQQPDQSQASERSRLRSAISVPHTSRHFHSSSPNEIPPTPDRSQASSLPPARANNRGHNRHSQLQSPHHRQPASYTHRGALNTPLGRICKRSSNSGSGQSSDFNVSRKNMASTSIETTTAQDCATSTKPTAAHRMLICGRRRGRRRSMRKKKDVTLCTFAACRRNAEETKEEKSLHVTEV
ncbi:hypothetical protein F7725_012952 [Dissostichus mawsoni]|uniref:Uncharacterized protein n=1 Tax=Dissostichus mawsoni TaxID=36200 RepID=A0A7J5YP57_DISMA|nr:hypothetical protein F7725_012952 [Dissostichus mawsoni]